MLSVRDDVDALPGVGPIVALTYGAAVTIMATWSRRAAGRHAAVPGWPECGVSGAGRPRLPISRMGLEGM